MRVTDEMVQAALDAQPFTANNSALRVWQLIDCDGDRTDALMRAALEAALSHAAGQDGEQCRAASGDADFAKMDAVYNFLMGISDLGGVAFGERHSMVRGQFWWRHDLAAAYASIRALSRGVPEGNQDVAAARRERDEAIEEKEYAELELAYLANEMVYEGNSIGWIASKAKKYGDALHRAWTALTEAGGKCDGQTELAEAIRQHFAAIVYGAGYIVDGNHVAPNRIEIVRADLAPAVARSEGEAP